MGHVYAGKQHLCIIHEENGAGNFFSFTTKWSTRWRNS